MNEIKVFRCSEDAPVDRAPAGCFGVVTQADDHTLLGAVVRLPYCTNEPVIILNRLQASTDRYHGIRRVKPLAKGDAFTVTVG